MKLFCTLFAVMFFTFTMISTILIGQYVSIFGPDWLIAANDESTKGNSYNGPIIFIVGILFFVQFGFLVFFLDSIWSKKKE